MITNVNDKIEKKDFQRQIGWEKWVDPFGSDVSQVEWPGAFGNTTTDKLIERANRKERQIMGIDDDDDEDWDDDELDYKMGGAVAKPKFPDDKENHNIPIIATKMGLVPILEHTQAGKIFNFWVAHTNFRMTKELLNIVNETDGIESLDLYTPYRWRIAIGKAFDSAAVKEDVTKNLNAVPLRSKINEQKNG